MVSLRDLTPLQHVTLRFAVIALLFYGLAALEGMMMRAALANLPLLEPEHFYAVLNAHPIVGIFGYSFMLIMGVFSSWSPRCLRRTSTASVRLSGPGDSWLPGCSASG